MPLYAITIFCSSFLLFLVQPIIAKQILPWFGGSATVWTTCLVFFRRRCCWATRIRPVVRRLSGRAQAWLQAALLAASCALLPIIPAARWKPLGTETLRC
jgi:hypothetical protein